MSRYLVTGAAGFLGSHLSRLLSRQGHEVLAADVGLHPSAERRLGRLEQLPGVEVRRIDLCDRDAVCDLPAMDGVFHFAAMNGTANFYTRPFETIWHSTVPTVMLLGHYAHLEAPFFFYAGSSEAYASTVTRFRWPVPTAEDVPLGVDDPRQSRWSYGASKLHGEVACFAAEAQTGLPVVVGRFHNAYGPDMGPNHVIPDFISRGRVGRFELFGATDTRSFIYVDDAVNAATVLAERAIGQVVNIGSPHEVTMLELAQLIMREAGWEGPITVHPSPVGSVERRAPDLSRLAEFIDVDSLVPLADGIRRTLQGNADSLRNP